MHFFCVLLNCIIFFNSTHLSGNHFAPNYWPEEPRLEKEWLTSIDIQQGHIAAYKEYKKNGELVPLFSIIPSLKGPQKLSGYDLYIKGYQNLIKGFFISGGATYQSLRIATQSDKRFLKKWSDLVFQAGWTYSYKNTVELDFIDYTIKAGFYKPDPSVIINEFDRSFKTNSGGILSGQVSIGLFEWLTIGFNSEAIIAQQGDNPTKEAQSFVNGNIITLETFIKADHVAKGFSCGLGYSFCHEFEKSSKNIFASTQHSIHLMLEYDFTKKQALFGPRIGFILNTIVGGKNCIKSSITQGSIGLEIAFNH